MAEPKNPGIASSMGAPDAYDAYEPFHPGYKNMRRSVTKHVIASMPEGAEEIVDIGSGTGIITERVHTAINRYQQGKKGPTFGKVITTHALEPAPEVAAFLSRKLEQKEIESVRVHISGVLEFLRQAAQDPNSKIGSLYSTFTEHHIQPKDKAEELKAVAETLKRGAELVEHTQAKRQTEGPAYIIGDEFLPAHEEDSPRARVEALVSYHGDVILRAVERGCVMLPKLELQALISGLHNVEPFLQQMAKIRYEEQKAHYNARYSESGCEFGPFDESWVRKSYDPNQEGLEKLDAYIERIEEIHKAYKTQDTRRLPETFKPAEPSMDDPTKMQPMSKVEHEQHFEELIAALRHLRKEMACSEHAGLAPDANMREYGDYKMTVRQFVKFLHQAGLEVQGYFMGPGYKGWEGYYGICTYDTDKKDRGKSIGFYDSERDSYDNHAMGGVWVLKAMAGRFQNRADVMIGDLTRTPAILPL